MTETSPPDPSAPGGQQGSEEDSVAFEDLAYRAAVVDLLGAITYGEISAFERLADGALPAAYARLRAIPGIGPWTAAEVGVRALGGRPARLRLRSLFVVGQVTMSLVLVIAAGLFMRTLAQASNAPTGFDHDNVDVVSVDLSLARYKEDTGRIFAREPLKRPRCG